MFLVSGKRPIHKKLRIFTKKIREINKEIVVNKEDNRFNFNFCFGFLRFVLILFHMQHLDLSFDVPF